MHVPAHANTTISGVRNSIGANKGSALTSSADVASAARSMRLSGSSIPGVGWGRGHSWEREDLASGRCRHDALLRAGHEIPERKGSVAVSEL